MGYRKLAKYIINQGDKDKSIEKNFWTYNSGILFCDSSDLKDKDIQILLEKGYIKRKYLNNGESFVYPALLNVMPVAAAYEIMDIVLEQSDDDELYDSLIRYSQLFPYPDCIEEKFVIMEAHLVTLLLVDLFVIQDVIVKKTSIFSFL